MFKKLIKRFDFTTRFRKELTFSDKDKIRLNDDEKTNQGLTLKGTSYDTGDDNYVLLPVTSPKRLKKWLGFEALENLPQGTSAGYRVVLSSGEYYHDGAAWINPTDVSHWNDFKEINRHIESLTLVDFDLQIKVKLKTTDVANTPQVKWIKLLAEVFIDPWDDLIYDTIVGSMRTSLRAITALEFEIVANTSSIDLNSDIQIPNKGYNFTNVVAAYNISSDPNQFKNIADSYNPGAARPDGTFEMGVVNLTEQVNAGEILRIEIEYVPEIAVYTNQDYYEPERLPAIIFERINTVRLRGRHDQELNDGHGEEIRDFDNMEATMVPRPRQSTVRFEFAVWASPLDMSRLCDGIDRWVSKNRILKSWGFDDTLNMDIVNELETSDKTNLDDVVMANGIFQLRGVPFYKREAKIISLVQTVNAEYEST